MRILRSIQGLWVAVCVRQRKKMGIAALGGFCYLTLKVLLLTTVQSPLEGGGGIFRLVVGGSSSPTVQSHLVTFMKNASQECKDLQKTILGVPPRMRRLNCSTCAEYTCHNMLFKLSSQTNFYKNIVAWMKKHPKKTESDQVYVDLAGDCDKFRNSRGYYALPVSPEEKDFPIAFNILMHRDAEQFERLLRTIYRPHNVYCIHVDQKASATLQKAVARIAGCLDNVFIASKLEKIVYAGYSRLQADINCMRDNLAHAVKWKYLINLAAQALPLKTNAELVKILNIYNGANDVEGIYGRRVLKGRFVNEWRENVTRMSKTGRKNPAAPHDIEIVRGSAYATFSRGFVDYILNDQKAKDLLAWSRTTYSPDEHYWATLHHTYNNPHLHPPGAYSGDPNKKPWLSSYAAWGGVDKCNGMWRRGVCIFGVEDLPLLTGRHELFVNKFYVDTQPLGMECMEQWTEYKTMCPPPLDEDYYLKLPFIIKES